MSDMIKVIYSSKEHQAQIKIVKTSSDNGCDCFCNGHLGCNACQSDWFDNKFSTQNVIVLFPYTFAAYAILLRIRRSLETIFAVNFCGGNIYV